MEDEADIVAEVGAERDDDSGELIADEAHVLQVGAVDSDSVRENRRLDSYVKKKRGHVKGVPFNADDMLTRYETLIKVWAANTLDISVKRLTGSPIERVITSRPRTGAELYDVLLHIHGQHEEAKYAVKFFDSNSKEFRGNGQITLPDTRPQQGYSMSSHYQPPPPSPYGAPPYYPHAQSYPQQAPPGYAPQSAPQSAQQPPPQPQPMPPPSGLDPMALMQQTFRMFNEMRESLQAQQQAYQVPPPSFQSAPQMPPPPQPTDPQAVMGWMQEMFRTLQQMQSAQAPAPAHPHPQPQFTAPAPAFDQMAMMRQMFEMFNEMRVAFQPPPQENRPPRPPYYPGGERPPYLAPTASPRPQTAAEQFRDALTVVRTAVDAAQEINSLIPSRGANVEHVAAPEEDEDSPVRIVDTGSGKLAFDAKEGTLRGWETIFANLDRGFKWFGEQREELQKAHAQQRQPRRELPPGYVEVTEGYEPPPGFVAVPVDEPPPVQQQRRDWDMPPMPTTEEG